MKSVYINDIASWCNVECGKFVFTSYNYDLYVNDVLTTDLVIPDGITEIKSTFALSKITSIRIPSSVKAINAGSFSDTFLQDVYIDDLSSWCKIEFGDEYANPIRYKKLRLKENLITELIIPDDVTEIKKFAFYGASQLTSVKFNNVTTIGDSAFYYCSGLTTLDLPRVRTIADWAFGMNYNITSITLPYTLKEIEDYAFLGCPIKTVNNASALQLTKGSTSNGYVAYNADVINVIPAEFKVYDGNSDVILATSLEETFDMEKSPNALVFAQTTEENLPANYVVDGETKSIVLTDAQPFYSPSNIATKKLTYTRTFNNTNWQSLYLPFSIDYDDWKDYADVAYINNVHQWDDDNDGEIDRTVLEFITKKSGSIEPNKPYVIKPKQTGEVTFTSENATLYAAPETDGYVDCRSTTTEYTLYGTYQEKTDMYANGYYAMADGGFKQAESASVTLSPFRTYLKIESRTGTGTVQNARRINIMVDGVMDNEATGIQNILPTAVNDNENVFNLSGQKVSSNYKSIIIKNGKKFIKK